MSEEQNRGAFIRKSSREVSLKSNHLLVIGIDAYTHDIPALNNAVKDAKDFQQLMEARYDITSTTALFNADATLENIINAFDKLSHSLTENDNLLVYFSGHGELVNKRGYWLPADAFGGKRHTYLTNHFVRDMMKDTKAFHILMIVDACFSGSLLSNMRSIKQERYYHIPSRWVLTSGQVEPVPDGAPGKNSPFARSLLTQLKHNPKPYLSLSELWVNMREGIISNSKQTPACEPVRDADHQGGEFYFIDENAENLPEIPVEKESIKEPIVEAVSRSVQVETEPLPDLSTLDGLKDYLRKCMMAGDPKKAFETLVEKLAEDSPHKMVVYMRLSNLNSLEKDIVMGVAENAQRQKAQINQALDYVIGSLGEGDLG